MRKVSTCVCVCPRLYTVRYGTHMRRARVTHRQATRHGRLHAEYTAALGRKKAPPSPHTADTQGRKHPSNSRMQGQTHAASNTASSNNLQQHSNTARQAGAPATQVNQSPPCVGSQKQASAQGGAGAQTPTGKLGSNSGGSTPSRITTLLEGGRELHLSVVQHHRPYESGRKRSSDQPTLIPAPGRGEPAQRCAGGLHSGRLALSQRHASRAVAAKALR